MSRRRFADLMVSQGRTDFSSLNTPLRVVMANAAYSAISEDITETVKTSGSSLKKRKKAKNDGTQLGVKFSPTYKVREVDVDGNVEGEFHLAMRAPSFDEQATPMKLTSIILTVKGDDDAAPPFKQRTLEASKIVHHVGRASGKLRIPSSENAIFDCKVMSRRHATIWVEGSRCFVRDLGSSNGTYVNGVPVPKRTAEGVELRSGDLVQFGEDVEDNMCVRASVKFKTEGEEEAETERLISDEKTVVGRFCVSPSIEEVEEVKSVSVSGGYEVNDVCKWQDVTEDELIVHDEVDSSTVSTSSSPSDSGQLQAKFSALDERCGVLERVALALTRHHRNTYRSIVYLSFSVLLLIFGEIIRQSVTLEYKLRVW